MHLKAFFSSVWRRYVKSPAEKRKRKKRASRWISELPVLPQRGTPAKKTLLIIRVDDIGDYILFRPALESLRKSKKYGDWRISLLGNRVWAGLFEALDAGFTDEFIPLDKGRWFSDPIFRQNFLRQLYQQAAPAEVWLASRTRHFFLEDILVHAFPDSRLWTCGENFSDYPDRAERNFIAAQNRTNIFPDATNNHEWLFNQEFTEKICGHSDFKSLPKPEHKSPPRIRKPYTVFFPGASAGSKRWPARNFAQLACLLTERKQLSLCIAGSAEDSLLAAQILKCLPGGLQTVDFCGKTDLVQLIILLQGANLVVSNDTGAAHIAALSGVPLIALCNGSKYGRFFPYPPEFEHVVTIYPEKPREAFSQTHFDMARIKPEEVFRIINNFGHQAGYSNPD